ncbi:hypothetical protein [Brucella thiophenivorans]|uniref:hypothetical protein n=1 Tax=Brucella thiophenivorans TaxID=571255 RepID=UPI001F3E9FDF|nr:hypothetical protein [Brucella thiophenivorans]
MDGRIHQIDVEHLPFFITVPGQTDVLFSGMVAFMLVVILVVGNLYFQLHALPERMAHRTNLVQMEVVAVLVLISLFTHNHFFWIAGLLLALIRIPDFTTPLVMIAGSVAQIAGQQDECLKCRALADVPLNLDNTKVPTEPPSQSALVVNSENLEHAPVEGSGTYALKEGN